MQVTASSLILEYLDVSASRDMSSSRAEDSLSVRFIVFIEPFSSFLELIVNWNYRIAREAQITKFLRLIRVEKSFI